MKLKDLSTGKIWDIISVSVMDENSECRIYSGGYDLVADPSSEFSVCSIDHIRREVRANSIDINSQLSIIKGIILRLDALESKSNHRNP